MPEKSAEKQVQREVVSVGIDFRPIPIDMGDGTLWMFNPDPDPADWSALTQALMAFGAVGAAMSSIDKKNPDVEKIGEATSQLDALVGGLTSAIVKLLVEVPQRKKFTDRGYSMTALQQLTHVLMEQLSGFPTK